MMTSSLTRAVDLSPQPAAARHQVATLLADSGWRGDVDGVLLAVHEALVNAQRHGGGVTRATATMDENTIIVEVRDRGRGFGVPDDPATPDPAAERGRGLFLIRRLASAVDVSRVGGEVRLVLRFKG